MILEIEILNCEYTFNERNSKLYDHKMIHKKKTLNCKIYLKN